MNEDLNHAHSNPETSFEREDLSTRGVFVFMIGLAITGLIIYFIIVGMYSFLDKYEHAQMSTASPLVTSRGPAARVVTNDYMEKFKGNGAPMLESDERGQFKDFLLKQEDQLNSYGWVDEQAGVAHIPIERAMDLIVERGLPVRPQGGNESATLNDSKPPAKKAAAKQ
ncbi:MAG: hypothetical protein WCC04_06045 [Terriglobales bacterium]